MAHIRFLLIAVFFLVVPIAASGEQKQCGAETCGAPTKTTKTIGGVAHNCLSTACSKSCCSLGDPPVCSCVSGCGADFATPCNAGVAPGVEAPEAVAASS